MAGPAVEWAGVSAGYAGTNVLKGISGTIECGVYVLLGPNGSGKTTLFRAITGVLRPFEGRLSIFGESPTECPTIRAQVGYVPHDPGLPSALTAGDVLRYWGMILGLAAAERNSRIDSLAVELNFVSDLSRRVGILSRGQRQRLSVARAMMGNPRLLLLDEPTTGLDPAEASRLRAFVKRWASQGRAVIYATHNIYEALDVSNQVLILAHGAFAWQGPTEDLVSREPATPGTQVNAIAALEREYERLTGIR